MATAEGFLCPVCRKDLGNITQLQKHYEDNHANDEKRAVRQASKEVEIKEEDFVTRAHWEPDSASESCREPGCSNLFKGVFARRHHSRRCGKLFCSDHCQLQMRLSANATPDAEHGVWCKVCKSCFETRDHFEQTEGQTRSHTKEFEKLRKKTISRIELETNKILSRLEKVGRWLHLCVCLLFMDVSLST
eukprot:Colp12_sorted_trinity150504_noHs@3099